MKKQNSLIMIPQLLILVVLFVFANSCKKDDNNNTGIPVLSTTAVTDITQATATCGGNITSDGGATVTARGVCWSTGQTPTISDNKTTDGTGAGEFSSILSGLSPNTTYYVRAYATNSSGTGYGSAMSFTTQEGSSGGTFTDTRDGKVYQTVVIGTQEWMAENLAYLPSVVSPGTGSNTTSYYYVYGYDGASVSAAKSTANYTTYGVLYNWPAAMNSSASSSANPSGVQGVCPTGWHLPSDAEWTELTDYLGGESVAGGKLKETGTTHWASPNTGATNETGFTALPGGSRSSIGGSFGSNGDRGGWWSATEDAATFAWSRRMYGSNSGVSRYFSSKELGFSVRCVRD
jgi:uncharacterized protein (TIGR02145 family)